MNVIVLIIIILSNGRLVFFLYKQEELLNKKHAKTLMKMSIIFSFSYIIATIFFLSTFSLEFKENLQAIYRTKVSASFVMPFSDLLAIFSVMNLNFHLLKQL
jgi:hypothetical protein